MPGLEYLAFGGGMPARSPADDEDRLEGGKWKCGRCEADPDLSPASTGRRKEYVEELLYRDGINCPPSLIPAMCVVDLQCIESPPLLCGLNEAPGLLAREL